MHGVHPEEEVDVNTTKGVRGSAGEVGMTTNGEALLEAGNAHVPEGGMLCGVSL